jgi:hypothetical protein
MFHDETTDEVWRDYCIQHLGTWYGKEGDAGRRETIRDVLWAATAETDSSIGGTALISLKRASEAGGIDRARLAETALARCLDDGCGELTKITALQICAELGETGVLPTARAIADSKRSVPLRMSAIAVLGTLGNEEDRSLLEPYAQSTDTRLRTAARSALERLSVIGMP